MYFNKKNIKILIFLSLFLFSINYDLNAQNRDKEKLDSLYNLFVSTRLESKSDFNSLSSEVTEVVKCGLPLISEVLDNMHNFTLKQQDVLTKLMQREERQKSIVTPQGYFRIHYDTIGNFAPRYFDDVETSIENLAEALDSVYKFEVEFLGFPPPPQDNNEGGDNLYDIYVQNAFPNYGYTQPEFSGDKGASYIVIHNDFDNFNTKGIDAAKVTAAHEFHHAIQLGNYIFRNNDIFFYEMTSTSMEEFVFDDVNDYYFYMPSYFNNTSASFTNTSGYDIAVWNIFLKERLGFNIIKRQWELLPEMRAMHAINSSILEIGSTFKTELAKFGLATFFTDERYEKGLQQGFVFEEGKEYPPIEYLVKQDFGPPEDMLNLNLYPASNSFILVKNNLDTLIVIVTNSDVTEAVNHPSTATNLRYFLFNYNADGSTRLSDSYFKKEEAANLSLWKTSSILNNILLDESIILPGKIDFAFPSPFVYGRRYQNGEFIRIPVNNSKNSVVDFNVYTSSMELVFSNSIKLEFFQDVNSYVIKWNALDNERQRLASGVYVYAIKSGDEVTLGKLVIFNE